MFTLVPGRSLQKKQPTALVGIVKGDIIVEVDEKRIADGDDLQKMLQSKNGGDTMDLTAIRDGQRRSVKVKLQEMPIDSD